MYWPLSFHVGGGVKTQRTSHNDTCRTSFFGQVKEFRPIFPDGVMKVIFKFPCGHNSTTLPIAVKKKFKLILWASLKNNENITLQKQGFDTGREFKVCELTFMPLLL